LLFRKTRIFLRKGLDSESRGERSDLPVGLFAQAPAALDALASFPTETLSQDLGHHPQRNGCEAARDTYSGMPANRQACDNLSVSCALRNLVLSLEMRRPGFSCTMRALITRASSTRPDIARHAARISCAFR
jgi:hypothetical protein